MPIPKKHDSFDSRCQFRLIVPTLLNTHKYSSLSGPNGEEMIEAYAENHTPGAYRVFFYYPKEIGLLILLISIL